MKKSSSYVIGTGQTKFQKLKRKVSSEAQNLNYPTTTAQAINEALSSCSLDYFNIEAAIAGYCYGDPTSGQRALYECGLSGIPILNVNNNCSTGSSALYMARLMIESGQFDCVLAVGFEEMDGQLKQLYYEKGWQSPTENHWKQMNQWNSLYSIPSYSIPSYWNEFTTNVTKLFTNALFEHQFKYGSTRKQLAQIAYKNHRQAKHNSKAFNQKEYSMNEILEASFIVPSISTYEIAHPVCGAAAVIIVSNRFLRNHPSLQSNAIKIEAQSMTSDTSQSFDSQSFIQLSGFELAQRATQHALYQAQISSIQEIHLIELHDCYAINELLMYEALGLCPIGKGGEFIEKGKWKSNTYGSEYYILDDNWIVNSSGGLEAKGHPLGATGIAQCIELVSQLQQKCNKRQIPFDWFSNSYDEPLYALQHNYGIGGAAVVTIYSSCFSQEFQRLSRL